MIIIYLILILALIILNFFKSKKTLHMLQQNYYDESERYFLWILNNPKKVWLEWDISFLFLVLLFL